MGSKQSLMGYGLKLLNAIPTGEFFLSEPSLLYSDIETILARNISSREREINACQAFLSPISLNNNQLTSNVISETSQIVKRPLLASRPNASRTNVL